MSRQQELFSLRIDALTIDTACVDLHRLSAVVLDADPDIGPARLRQPCLQRRRQHRQRTARAHCNYQHIGKRPEFALARHRPGDTEPPG